VKGVKHISRESARIGPLSLAIPAGDVRYHYRYHRHQKIWRCLPLHRCRIMQCSSSDNPILQCKRSVIRLLPTQEVTPLRALLQSGTCVIVDHRVARGRKLPEIEVRNGTQVRNGVLPVRLGTVPMGCNSFQRIIDRGHIAVGRVWNIAARANCEDPQEG
jgi:hypothetical protein